MRLGFIGMGIMGSPMAVNLLKAGFDVMVWNRTLAKCEVARDNGAEVAESLKQVAENTDVVFICVSDTPDVEAVLFGDEGLAEHLKPGQIVVDHSSISPIATEEFAVMLEAMDIDFVDAPVSGGENGAINATLTIMCGGKETVVDSLRPMFEAMGKNIVYCGHNGQGQRTKVVNQIICALNIMAMSEGLRYAQSAGLDMKTTLEVVSSGAAGSWMLSNLGPKILAGDWAPGFMIRLQAKDLRIASEELEEMDGVTNGVALVTKLFDIAVREGIGDEGTQALIKILGWAD